jgi:hypothetical protein
VSGRPGLRHLIRLAQAAPAAFRHDPLFRLAVFGAGLALLVLLARLGGREGTVPGPPSPPATLGSFYGDRTGTPVEPATTGPIPPGRPLGGLVIRPDPTSRSDRFGTLGAAQPVSQEPP